MLLTYKTRSNLPTAKDLPDSDEASVESLTLTAKPAFSNYPLTQRTCLRVATISTKSD